MTQSNRTAMNVAFVSATTFLQIVIQFLFFGVLAALYGAVEKTDALAGALVLPMVLSAIITGSIAYVLIPELVAKFETDDTRSAWQLASFVGCVSTAISLLVSILLWFGAEHTTGWLYEMSPSEHALTARLLRILSVQVVLTGLISWLQAVHHSRHQFLMPAIGGVLGTGLSLGLVHWFGNSDIGYGSRDIGVIAWAINAGSLVSVVVHLVPLLPKLKVPHADSESLFRLFGAFWPLLLGSAFIRLDPIVDRVWASELDSGSMAHINYAQRIMMALLAIGTGTLSLIAFPQLSQRLATDGQQGFADHFALALRRTVLMVVPVVLGFSCFSVNIVGDLLERGEFLADDSRVVGYLVVALMGMFVGASIAELLARGFYVLGDTKTPTIIGAAALALGLVLKFALFKYIGIWGIAIGVSAYYCMSATALGVLLANKVNPSVFCGSLLYLAQSVVSALLACGCSYLVYASGWGSTWLAGPAGVIVYLVTLVLLRNNDALQLVQILKQRFSRG